MKKHLNRLFSSFQVSSEMPKDENEEEQGLISLENKPSLENWTALMTKQRPPTWLVLITGTNILFLLTFVSILIFGELFHQTEMNHLLKQTSFYSPILDRFEIPSHIQRVNGSLFQGPNASLHRQLPSPEVEKYWADFEPIRPFPITRAELLAIGRDPEISVRFHDSLGLGPEAYVAHFDVFHQIHCLNALRKTAFKDYPEYPTNPHIHKPDLKYIHLAHCIDILMQNLMCQPNVDLITYNWVETQSIPVADFNINHQCRDWDTIAEWQKENSIPEDQWVGMPKTDDIKWLPQEQGFFDVFGHDEHDHDRIVSTKPHNA